MKLVKLKVKLRQQEPVLTAQVNESLLCPHGFAGYRHAAVDLIYHTVKNLPVLECAGLPFIGVADNILL